MNQALPSVYNNGYVSFNSTFNILYYHLQLFIHKYGNGYIFLILINFYSSFRVPAVSALAEKFIRRHEFLILINFYSDLFG